MRRTVCVDIDGVVVGGIYIPEWDRQPSIYSELQSIDGACNALWHLNNKHRIYYVTSRSFINANITTIDWLKKHNFPLGCGVITSIPSAEKFLIAKSLGAAYHVDDNPSIVTSMIGTGVQGVLFVGRDEKGWWSGTREWIDSGRPYFDDWTKLAKFISTRLS